MKIFSGSASQPLAEKIAQEFKLPLSPVDMFVFPDGERRVRVTDNVLEEHCLVVQSASPSVDEHYMELFFIIDSLRRSGASLVTVVLPYFGYQRQDHVFRTGEAVSLEVIINILSSLKVDNVVSVDMHASRIPDLFPTRIHVSHLSALPLFAEKIKKEGWDTNETILVSPDMGGIRRIKMLSELVDGMPYIATEKNRDLETGSLEESRIGEGELGNAKRAVIVDDMISSGGTIVSAAKLLKQFGVEEMYTFVTHSVFSNDAPTILQLSDVQKIFVTDTVTVTKEKQFEKLEILSVAPAIVKEIRENIVKGTRE